MVSLKGPGDSVLERALVPRFEPFADHVHATVFSLLA